MSKEPYSLLFTAGGSPGMEALYRQLSGYYNLYFADMDPTRISPIIPSCRRLEIPSAQSPAFAQVVIDHCRLYNITLLIPGVDEELGTLWSVADALNPTHIFLPKPDFVATMTDKLEMSIQFLKNNLGVPATTLAINEISRFRFPVIIKPRWGRGSRNIFEIATPEKFHHFRLALDGNLADWVVQEKIDGDEFTVQVIAAPDSSLTAILPIQVFEKRGSTVSAELRFDQTIHDYCSQIHAIFRPEGSYNVQLIKDDAGRIFCFEINPRISTTFCLATEIGLDPFLCFCQRTPAIPLEDFPPRIRLTRHWINDFEKV